MKLINLAFLAGVAVAMGCGGSTKAKTTPPPPPTGGEVAQPNQPPPPDDEQLVRLFEQLAAQVTAAGTDCNKYAQHLSSFVLDHGKRYKELNAQVRATPTAADRLSGLKTRLENSLATVVQGYARCKNSTAASNAFTEFDGLLDPRHRHRRR